MVTALKLDWNKICPSEKEGSIFIIGNPPYVGSSMQSKDQKLDMSEVFKDINSYKNLDYISCWFFLASKYIQYNFNDSLCFNKLNYPRRASCHIVMAYIF